MPYLGVARLLKSSSRWIHIQRMHAGASAHLPEAAQLDERAADCQWYYFLWSPSLTPELVEPFKSGYVDSRATAVLSLSGLINIQYRHQFRGREEPTEAGCVHKVRSDEGELVLHSEYEKVYRSLLRSLRKNRS